MTQHSGQDGSNEPAATAQPGAACVPRRAGPARSRARYARLLRAGWRRAELLRARWSLMAALSALALGVFTKLTSELNEGELDGFDRAVLARVIQLRVPSLNGAAVDLTALGSFSVLTLLVTIVALFLAIARDYLRLTQLLVASIGGGFISSLLKHVLERERPDEVSRLVEVSSFSYPSGHSFASASIYLTLAIVASSRLPTRLGRWAAFVIAVLLAGAIGASRAYLGVHYPSDIVAGLSLGGSWALLVSAIASYASLSRQRARDAAQR